MSKSLRVAYGEAITEYAASNDKIMVFDADLAGATQSAIFKNKYPDRFFDMGIAEQNMIGVACGFAHTGYIPFVNTFAIFGAGRGYEVIRNSAAYANLNIKFAFSHSGLSVGEDGGSHQCLEDIALMRVIPHMTVLVPCDEIEMRKAVKAAIDINGPVYIRTARPVSDIYTSEDTPFTVGKASIIKDGKDACIIACGLMMKQAIEASKLLEDEGVSCAVVDMHTIKPIDRDIILSYNKKCKVIVTVEEHSVIGGLGSAVSEVLAGEIGAKFAMVGVEDKFGKSGKPDLLFKEYGLTAEHIVKEIKEKM